MLCSVDVFDTLVRKTAINPRLTPLTLVATKRALHFGLIEDCALEAVSISDGSQRDAMVGAPAAIPTGVPLTLRIRSGSCYSLSGCHCSPSVPAGRSGNAKLQACHCYPIRAVRVPNGMRASMVATRTPSAVGSRTLMPW